MKLVRRAWWAGVGLAIGTIAGGQETVRVEPQLAASFASAIEFHPSEPKLLVLDWYHAVGLWDVADPSQPVRLLTIRKQVRAARFGPDGESILTTDSDGYVHSWSMEGELIAKRDIGVSPVVLEVDHDSDLVAASGEFGVVQLLDRNLLTIGVAEVSAKVLDLEFCNAGSLLAVTRFEANRSSGELLPVEVWSTSADEEPQRTPLVLPAGRQLCWIPSAERLAIFSFDADILDLVSLEPGIAPVRLDLDSPPDGVSAPRSGSFWLTSCDGVVQSWNQDSVRVGGPLRCAADGTSIPLSADGSLLATRGDRRNVLLWSLAGAPLGSPRASSPTRWALVNAAFAGDDAVYSTVGGNTVYRVEIASGPSGTPVPWPGPSGASCIAVSPDGSRIALADLHGVLRLCDDRGQVVQLVEPNTNADRIDDVRFSRDGDMLAGSTKGGSIRIWTVDPWTERGTTSRHLYEIASFCFLGEQGRIVSLGKDRMLRHWDLAGAEVGLPRELPNWSLDGESGERAWNANVSATRDGRAIVACTPSGWAHVFDQEGVPIGSPIDLGPGPGSAKILPAGDRIAVADSGLGLRFISLPWERFTPIIELPRGTGWMPARDSYQPPTLEISASGGRIAVIDGPWIQAYDLRRSVVGTIDSAPQMGSIAVRAKTFDVAIWPTGSDLVIHDRAGVVRTRFDPGVDRIPGPVAFHPTEPVLATGHTTGEVRFWDLDGSPIGNSLRHATEPIHRLVFDQGGEKMASASSSGEVCIWSTSTGQLLDGPTPIFDRAYELQVPMAFDPTSGELLIRNDTGALLRLPQGARSAPDPLELSSFRETGVAAISPDARWILLKGQAGFATVHLNGASPPVHFGDSAFEYFGEFAIAPSGDRFVVQVNDAGLRVYSPHGDVLAQGPDVGFEVDALEFAGPTPWAFSGSELAIFDPATLEPRLRAVFGPGDAVAWTPDGWYSGEGELARTTRLFGEGGRELAAHEALRRFSPERVRAALADPDDSAEHDPGASKPSETSRWRAWTPTAAGVLAALVAGWWVGRSGSAPGRNIVLGSSGSADNSPPDTPRFDVVLAFPSEEREFVRRIYGELIARGLRPWMDQEDLQPGLECAERIERVLQEVPTMVVFLGPKGIGKGQRVELQIAHEQQDERGLIVIPALLPGVDERAHVPPVLRRLSHVRFTKSKGDRRAIDKLEFGIRGKKPSEYASPSSSGEE